MTSSAATAIEFLHCLNDSRAETAPYGHWHLRHVFTDAACEAMAALPFDAPPIGDTRGKRETHNSSRTFFSARNRARFAVCREVAEALQDTPVVRRVEEVCGVALNGSYLRIEYCQDVDGFWLEPHTDIPAKLFTMLVHLSTDPDSSGWGTDIFDDEQRHVATAPCEFNCGLIFIPGKDTWHGFRKRPINGVRKLLIVNYVKNEWRARDELAFPGQPVN